ncbi:MAG: DUF294 nucleotidyltransferase-like domain-containing protein, partial [Desulfotignum sp.]
SCVPLSRLELMVDDLVPHIEVAYHQAGTMILEKGQENHFLFFIRSGAVEILRSSGELYTQIGEGECFGQFSLLRKKQVRYAARALEDTLVYKIPDEHFQTLADTYDEFADFMEEERSIRLKNALGRSGQEYRNPLMISKIHKLVHREIVTASPAVSIQQAAVIMTENRVSSLILLADTPEPDQSPVVGLITDRDIRKRAVARGLPLSTPVREIMSTDIISLQATEYAFEAMLTMMRHNLHHLPVLEGNRPLGVITVADLVRYESYGSVYLVGDIFRQNDVAGLAAMATKIKQFFVHLVNEDATSHTIGAAISRMGISISRRLLELGEKQLGPPPIPYCLLALGSMARDEMTLVTDQDNAFVLDDTFDPDRHDSYFKALDLETTGMDPENDAIVRVGFIPLFHDRILCSGARYWVVRPDQDRPDIRTVIHGITHTRMDACPRFEDILAPLLEAMSGRVVVAHYSRLEREFLGRTVSELTGDCLMFPMVDTMELESRKHPVFRPNFLQRWMGKKDSLSLRLAHVRERYNLPPYHPHHALTDALAAAELFLAQVADQFTPDTPVSDLLYHPQDKG